MLAGEEVITFAILDRHFIDIPVHLAPNNTTTQSFPIPSQVSNSSALHFYNLCNFAS
jgi:hypothetical protein